MEINLIPQRSPYEKYRFAIILFLSLLFLTGIGSAVWHNLHLNNQIAYVQEEVKRTLSDTAILRAERTVKKEDVLFNDLSEKIIEIKGKEHDFGQMLDRIAALLSEQTKVVAADVDADQGIVTLSITSDSIVAIADYAELLRAEPWARQVLVEKIQNNSKGDKALSAAEEAPAQPYSTSVRIELRQKKEGGGS